MPDISDLWMNIEVGRVEICISSARGRKKEGFSVRAYFATVILVVGFVFSTLAFAQDVGDHVKVSDTPDWVKILPLPSGTFEAAKDTKVGYRIVDYQNKIDPTNRVRFRRFYKSLNNSQALEDEGTLGITFDPTYQKLSIHSINIIRQGRVIDKIKSQDFKTFKVETETDKLLYNGDVQFSYAVTDLRVGDGLDYSYSITGRNPAFMDSYFLRQSQQYSVPVETFQTRVLIHQSLDVHTRKFNDGILAEPKTIGSYQNYTVLKKNMAALTVDDDRPAWHYGFPTVEFSSFESWPDVAQAMEEYYTLTLADKQAARSIVQEIKGETDSQEKQAELALKYVQKNIRYLGIELGEGGYIPRRPAKTLAQRFGDCKDVTMLLMAILEGLGIEAAPILVDTTDRSKFTQTLPTTFAFNHVIVGASIKAKPYFLDATRSEQLGDLDNLDQGSYGKGLKIKAGSSGVIDMPLKEYTWRKDFEDTFDLVSDPGKITFTTKEAYFGQDADSTLSWYKNDGLAEVEKVYLNYYKDFFPNIVQLKPIEVNIDNEVGSITLISYYEIPEAWTHFEDDNLKQFYTVPYELRADMPKFVGADRTAPMKISYPRKIRQTLKYLVNETWAFDEAESEMKTDSLDYKYQAKFADNIYTETYTFETLQDHMSEETFSEDMKTLNGVRDNLDTTIQTSITPPSGWETWSEETWNYIAIFGVAVASIISFFFAAFIKDFDIEWRNQVIMHPVSLKKFLILTVATLGTYQIYWFYKNWQWVLTARNEQMWPAVRSFFSGIMNFALFPRIADESQSKGYGWYPALALPLAFLFFAGNILDRAIARVDSMPDWAALVSLAGMFISLPVAMQVKRINNDNPELIAKNSKFTWRSYGLIIVFLPIAFLSYLGCGYILAEILTGKNLV